MLQLPCIHLQALQESWLTQVPKDYCGIYTSVESQSAWQHLLTLSTSTSRRQTINLSSTKSSTIRWQVSGYRNTYDRCLIMRLLILASLELLVTRAAAVETSPLLLLVTANNALSTSAARKHLCIFQFIGSSLAHTACYKATYINNKEHRRHVLLRIRCWRWGLSHAWLLLHETKYLCLVGMHELMALFLLLHVVYQSFVCTAMQFWKSLMLDTQGQAQQQQTPEICWLEPTSCINHFFLLFCMYVKAPYSFVGHSANVVSTSAEEHVRSYACPCFVYVVFLSTWFACLAGSDASCVLNFCPSLRSSQVYI